VFVLRKQPPGGVSNATAHRMDREFAVLQALQKSDVPAPKPIAYCADASVLGGSFYLMTFIKGRVLSSPALVGMQPNERRAAYRSVVETLVKIHSVDWRAVGLSDYGLAGNMYGRQLSSLLMVSDKQQAVSTSVPRIPHRDEMVALMRDNMPDDAVALVHGDFKWDNILMHPTEPRVVGVLDWELSTIGHPMSDVANMCGAIYYSPYNPQAVGGGGVLGMENFEESGIPTQDELLQYYAQLTKRDHPDPDMNFFMAFYFWRGAIISQGIGARLAAKQASSTFAKDFAAMTGPLGEMARNQMDALLETKKPRAPVAFAASAHKLKLEDCYTHKPSASEVASGFAEETHVQFAEPAGAFAGLASFFNKPAEKTCEVKLVVFLRDGSCVVATQTRPLHTNNGFAVGASYVDVVRPMENVRVVVNAKGVRSTRPWALQASGGEPMDIEADLTFASSSSPVYALGKADYTQAAAVTGSVFARGDKFGTLLLGVKANGGTRMHRWGTALPTPLRRCTGSFGPALSFSLSLVEGESASSCKGVVLLQGGQALEATGKVAIRLADGDDASIVDGQWHFGSDLPLTGAEHKRVVAVTLKVLAGNGVELELAGTVAGYVQGAAAWTRWTLAGGRNVPAVGAQPGWGITEVRKAATKTTAKI